MSPPSHSSVLVDFADSGYADLLPSTSERPGVAATSRTCFEDCSPLRTRCPGPWAVFSQHSAGRWSAICRLTAMAPFRDREIDDRAP